MVKEMFFSLAHSSATRLSTHRDTCFHFQVVFPPAGKCLEVLGWLEDEDGNTKDKQRTSSHRFELWSMGNSNETYPL